MNPNRPIAFVWASLVCALTTLAAPQPFLSPMFNDNMVLQRDKTNSIWGWAKPGEKVRVELSGRVATVTAAADGRWQAKIVPPPVGGPYTLQISGPQTITLTNVLVWDVWLCGGQSNMEMGMNQVRNN